MSDTLQLSGRGGTFKRLCKEAGFDGVSVCMTRSAASVVGDLSDTERLWKVLFQARLAWWRDSERITTLALAAAWTDSENARICVPPLIWDDRRHRFIKWRDELRSGGTYSFSVSLRPYRGPICTVCYNLVIDVDETTALIRIDDDAADESVSRSA